MRFSVIIPTHNNTPYLMTMLHTIDQQIFMDFEVIVIADKCKKEHLRAIRMLVKDQRFKCTLIETNYQNAGMARNAGLDVAQGDYILFADDDDKILHPYVFETISVLMAKSNADMALFGFIFGSLGYKGPFDNNGNAFGNVWSRCFKRSAIGDTRFPNVYPDDDLQFCNLMEEKPIKIVAYENPIYYYNYMRPGSISWNEKLTYKNKGD